MGRHSPISASVETARGEMADMGQRLADLLAETAMALEVAQEQREAGVPSTDSQLIDWAESLGAIIRDVPKVRDAYLEVIDAMRDGRIFRGVYEGPRGGGKTQLAALIELTAYRWFGADAANVGGSEKQALRCYEHIVAAHEASADLRRYSRQVLIKGGTKSHTGERIEICSASERSIRGAHPGGKKKIGMLVVDEAALMTKQLIEACGGVLSAADPSVRLELSTLGEDDSGHFNQLVLEHEERRYVHRAWDIFDVARRCEYDCETTCPVERFAKPETRNLPDGSVEVLDPAYCGGRAHDVDGWVSIDEIAQQWREHDSEWFEREMLCKRKPPRNRVWDPALIDQAVKSEVHLSKRKDDAEGWERLRRVDTAIGLDWGWAGETAACWAVRIGETLVVFRWEFWTQTRFSKIRQQIGERALEHRIKDIRPDGANPSDNEEFSELLSTMCQNASTETEEVEEPEVTAVHFGSRVPHESVSWKRYGIGEVRRRLERGLLLLPKRFNGMAVPNHQRAVQYLKGYRMRNGEPVKEEDHGPDALNFCCVGYSAAWSGEPMVR